MSAAAELHPVTSLSAESTHTRHPSAQPRVLSLRWIATTLAVMLSASAAISVGFISERNARAVIVDEIQTRMLLQVRSLSAGSSGALLTNFPELTLQPLVTAILSQQPELAFAVVLDHAGKAQGHPDTRKLGTVYQRPDGLMPVNSALHLAPGESLLQNRELLVTESQVSTPDGRVIGTSMVALNRAYIDQRLTNARRQQAVALVACLILSVALSFLLMSRLLSPLGTLRNGLKRIGQGDLETPIRLESRTELGMLAQTVNDMATDLRRAQAAMLVRERLEHEVDIARQIQRSLLPSEARRIGAAFVCGDQKPATEVGGDYYDILTLPDGRVAIAIADVAGKGLPGCLVMAMLSAVLRALRGAEESPSKLLIRIDEQFAQTLQVGMFVTMFYGILDPRTGQMIWASAGHNPMLVYRAASGTVEASESRGIPIGALRGGQIARTLKDQTLQLQPGDVMVHYTDGYSEAVSPGTQEQFGIGRMTDVVMVNGADGPQSVVAQLIARLHDWTGGGVPSDDETLLVVGWEPTEVHASAAGGADGGSRRGIELFEQAKHRGIGTQLEASSLSITETIAWVRSLTGFDGISEEDLQLLGTGLFEVCANIAEHGYGHSPEKRFNLWWLPPQDHENDPTVSRDRAVARYARSGFFVIRDDGPPYRPDRWKATDFNDRKARTRGRGFGLDIIFRAMRRAEYYPGTASGNITVLAFGPGHDHDSKRGNT